MGYYIYRKNGTLETDVIRALECCLSDEWEDCDECPLEKFPGDYTECKKNLMKVTIDLINRQKAEIEQLKKEKEEMHQDVIHAEKYAWELKSAMKSKECKTMIKIKNTEVFGWESAIRGMRNPMNSWDKSDSWYGCRRGDYGHIDSYDCEERCKCNCEFCIGSNDLTLMKQLIKAGSDHSKFMRMINVTLDITAPLYWWKEFDTYKVGTVRNSCSTMHKIAEKEFTLDDFSHEHLINMYEEEMLYSENALYCCDSIDSLEQIIALLNAHRSNYLNTKNKKYWWQMIQLLPSSYNQRATIQLNYAVLRNIYHARKNHKLDEWREFCKWIETLPYAELITATKPKAKWLKTADEICYSEKCSACGWQGRTCNCTDGFCRSDEVKNFCPNCGAEMEVNNGETN